MVLKSHKLGLMRRFSAFTLAEVLITLGIIGVVAAITIPTLIIGNQRKELETQFKKEYAQLSQVTQAVIMNDYGGDIPSVACDDSLTTFMDFYQKHYTKADVCRRGQSTCSTAIFPVSSGSAFHEFLYTHYQTFNGYAPAAYCNDGVMATADGSLLYFDCANSAEFVYGTPMIAIDVNGWQKKPNRYGQDFFIFQVSKSTGKLMPMGIPGTFFTEDLYCSKTSSSPYNGYGCTSKAMHDPDFFKNLP